MSLVRTLGPFSPTSMAGVRQGSHPCRQFCVELELCGLPDGAPELEEMLNRAVGGRNKAGIKQDKLNEPACKMKVLKCD